MLLINFADNIKPWGPREVAVALLSLGQARDVKAFFEFLVMVVLTLVRLAWSVSDFTVMGIDALV